VSIISSLLNNNNYHNQQTQIHYAEALFAAQTMVHRLRRVKLAEAIDVEFEPVYNGPDDVPRIPVSDFPPPPQQILEVYQRWILESYNEQSILAQCVCRYRPATSELQNVWDLEERIKGEISMLVLASVLDALTTSHHSTLQQSTDVGFSEIRPLLTMLSSALAIIAARMRYIPTHLPAPAPHTKPIVNMILEAISMVRPPCQQDPRQRENSNNLYFICLTATPDAIFQHAEGGGGVYGCFSLEPRCYAAVTMELKTQETTHIFQSLQVAESNASHHTSRTSSSVLLLQMLEAWVKYVPLPDEFIVRSIPVVLTAWQHESPNHLASLEAKAAMGYWIATMEGGSWTVKQVLVTSLIQSKDGSQQASKKRQSGRSKRRENQLLEERTNNNLLASAENEVRYRGQLACAVAQSTWPVFQELLERELQGIADRSAENGSNGINPDEIYDGQG